MLTFYHLKCHNVNTLNVISENNNILGVMIKRKRRSGERNQGQEGQTTHSAGESEGHRGNGSYAAAISGNRKKIFYRGVLQGKTGINKGTGITDPPGMAIRFAQLLPQHGPHESQSLTCMGQGL